MNKNILIFATVAFLLSCEKTIIVKENEAPHGGDGIQILFKNAQTWAIKKLSAIRNCSFRQESASDTKNWILQNSSELVKDLEQSEHAWEQSANVPCGRTTGTKNGKILLSYAGCKNLSPDDAFRVLVHESVHHFGVSNEEFATNVASEVFYSSNGNCVPEMNEIAWLDADVTAWPDTAHITNLEVSPQQICYDFKTAQKWPEIDPFDQWKTIGNYWVIAYMKDHWYATTYQWILPGHRCEQDTASSISEWTRHVEFYQPEVWKWIPQKGELVGLMVSSVRRFQISNGVEERTPIQWIRWPY